jgi:hypothetical protein
VRIAGCEALPRFNKIELTKAELEKLKSLKDNGLTVAQIAEQFPYSKNFLRCALVAHGFHEPKKYGAYNLAKTENPKLIPPSRQCNFCRKSFNPCNRFIFTCDNCKYDKDSPFSYLSYV